MSGIFRLILNDDPNAQDKWEKMRSDYREQGWEHLSQVLSTKCDCNECEHYRDEDKQNENEKKINS